MTTKLTVLSYNLLQMRLHDHKINCGSAWMVMWKWKWK